MYVYRSTNSVTVQRSEQIHFRCHSLPGTRGPRCKEDDVIWTEGISRAFSSLWSFTSLTLLASSPGKQTQVPMSFALCHE